MNAKTMRSLAELGRKSKLHLLHKKERQNARLSRQVGARKPSIKKPEVKVGNTKPFYYGVRVQREGKLPGKNGFKKRHIFWTH